MNKFFPRWISILIVAGPFLMSCQSTMVSDKEKRGANDSNTTTISDKEKRGANDSNTTGCCVFTSYGPTGLTEVSEEECKTKFARGKPYDFIKDKSCAEVKKLMESNRYRWQW